MNALLVEYADINMIMYSSDSRLISLVELGNFYFFPNRFFVVTQFATIFDMRIISHQTAEKVNLESHFVTEREQEKSECSPDPSPQKMRQLTPPSIEECVRSRA